MKTVSVKSAIKRILSWINEKNAIAPEKTSAAWASGAITAFKCGHIVTVKLQGVSFNAVSANTNVALLPEGYRPPTETTLILDGLNRVLFVEPNGSIQLRAGAATTCWGVVTYIAWY